MTLAILFTFQDGVTVNLTTPVLITAGTALFGVVAGAMKMSHDLTKLFIKTADKFEAMAIATQKQADETGKVIESMAESVVSLRISRHVHAEKFVTVEGQIHEIEQDVGDLWHTVRGPKP